jgi:hypothetical protein
VGSSRLRHVPARAPARRRHSMRASTEKGPITRVSATQAARDAGAIDVNGALNYLALDDIEVFVLVVHAREALRLEISLHGSCTTME